MTDNNLSSRAGLNIGTEPSLLPFIRSASGKPIVVPTSGDVVLAESSSTAARVVLGSYPFSRGGPGMGWAFATDPGGADFGKVVNVFFVDDQGNEIQIGATTSIGAPTTEYEIGPENVGDATFFCLAPGEKIIARLGSAPVA